MGESRKEKWARERAETLQRERMLWRSGLSRVAGVDEVGVGPLAGPVVAAAVVLPESIAIDGVRDSKKVSSRRREVLAEAIQDDALSVGIGVVEAADATTTAPRLFCGNVRLGRALFEVDSATLCSGRTEAFPAEGFSRRKGSYAQKKSRSLRDALRR